MRVLKIIIPIILLIVGVLFMRSLLLKKQEEDKKLSSAKIYPLIVESIKPTKKNVILTLSYEGIGVSKSDFLANTKFSSKILYIKNVGDEVKKGEVVAKLDDKELRENIKSIDTNILALTSTIYSQKAILNNLIDTLNRTKKLLKAKIASIEEVKNIENKILELKAQIKANEEKINSLKANKKVILNNLKYTKIISPIDGIVSAKFFNVNEVSAPAKPLLKISSKDSYLLLNLPKKYSEIVYKGKIYPLIFLNQAKNSMYQYKADINVINGESVKVKAVEFRGEAVLLPFDAVLRIDNNSYVVTKHGVKKVNVLAEGEEGIAVSNDLDEVVVAKPDILLKIKAGYPYRIKE
ncbi:efflux RND transporter periplasmic adaptor subunit [Caminibacter mediatlanticus]|uniref:Efflux RND transporter periplasmic adaptor subunit n=1 Tax=Caminibacter mediatlanticus TB-2 TaxID=391592 RepID=A0AAI9AH33_9BACT|nr:hypothetical protein [Caminibacter mediatlanticus]EDM23518.1 hypothetical protein CMTB2_08282 [Caminibacter mediatlanticus TB-2]